MANKIDSADGIDNNSSDAEYHQNGSIQNQE